MLKALHAVLHVFDLEVGGLYLSEREMDLDERLTASYVQRHLRRATQSVDSHRGTFEDGSVFASELVRYARGERDLVDFSSDVARAFWDELRKSDETAGADLLVAEFTMTREVNPVADARAAAQGADGAVMADAVDEATAAAIDAAFEGQEIRALAVMLLPRRKTFSHDMRTVEGHAINDVVRCETTLPNPTQKVATYAIIDLDSLEIDFSEQPLTIAGRPAHVIRDTLLSCTEQASSKEVVAACVRIAGEVAQEAGVDETVALSQAKAFVASNAERSTTLAPAEVGEAIFEERPELRERYETAIRKEHLPEEAPVRRAAATRLAAKHRIRTDTGIEVTFPSQYAGDATYLQFTREADGSVTIVIPNVTSITNR